MKNELRSIKAGDSLITSLDALEDFVICEKGLDDSNRSDIRTGILLSLKKFFDVENEVGSIYEIFDLVQLNPSECILNKMLVEQLRINGCVRVVIIEII